MCCKSSVKAYFLGCSPAGTPWGWPVVAAACAELVEPTSGAGVGVARRPGTALGAVLPSVFLGPWLPPGATGAPLGVSEGLVSAIPSGWTRPAKSYLPPLAILRTTAGFTGLRF